MNDLIDFTPELRAQALEVLKRYRWEESPYVPLIVGNVNGKLGTINIGNTAGGVNWPGSAFDPETGMVLHAGVELAGDGRVARAAAAGILRSAVSAGRRRSALPVRDGGRHRHQPRCAGRRSRRGGCGTRRAPAPAAARPAAAPAPAAATPAPTAPAAAHRPQARRRPAAGGGGEGGGGANVQGLSLVKPPYGVVAAIDVTRAS